LNLPLFRKFGSANNGLGILGLTVQEQYGGAGFVNATAVAIVHEELSYSDPALCLSYLAHSILLCNNLAVNGSHEQVRRVGVILVIAYCNGKLDVFIYFLAFEFYARSVRWQVSSKSVACFGNPLLLPTALRSSKIGGMCMSEPNAGTDVLGMKSNAVYDSARDGFILNGTKVSGGSSDEYVLSV
jgi:isovaleryl-CoA dehydrogenase